jgi:hypothetical protein
VIQGNNISNQSLGMQLVLVCRFNVIHCKEYRGMNRYAHGSIVFSNSINSSYGSDRHSFSLSFPVTVNWSLLSPILPQDALSSSLESSLSIPVLSSRSYDLCHDLTNVNDSIA